MNLFRIFIFQFVQTAAGAAVTEGLPLPRRHIEDGFLFPEVSHDWVESCDERDDQPTGVIAGGSPAP